MSLNVLVVDDSDVIRAMIARTLRLAQVPIGDLFEASNGKEALQVLDEAWIDLVLADINMPIMSGDQMVTAMRAKPETADVPIIVVSTEGATERIDQLMAQGVSAWIRKPFTPEEIRDVVSSVTSAFPLTDEYHATLDKVFGPVLETFAFVFPEPTTAEQIAETTGDFMTASVTFDGAACGTLSIAAPAELCVELAANILGLDPEDEDARMKGADTLGEIANIATGHVATELEAHAPVDLHPPIVGRLAQEDWDRTVASTATRMYLVEEQPVLVTLGIRPTRAR